MKSLFELYAFAEELIELAIISGDEEVADIIEESVDSAMNQCGGISTGRVASCFHHHRRSNRHSDLPDGQRGDAPFHLTEYELRHRESLQKLDARFDD